MKKWKIILPTLFATSGLPLVSLVGCGDPEVVEFKQDGVGQMSNYTTATISIVWSLSKHEMEFSNLSFSCSDYSTNVSCVDPTAHPCQFKITFDKDVVDDITDGVFSFHYEDKTAKTGEDIAIESVQISTENLKPKFNQVDVGLMTSGKVGTILIDWSLTKREIEFSNFSFSCSGYSATVSCVDPTVRPCQFKITFDKDIIDDITNGVFSFHYIDKTKQTEEDSSVQNIKISTKNIDPSFSKNGVGGVSDVRTATVSIDWAPHHNVQFTNMSFSCVNGTITSTNIKLIDPSAHPLIMEIKFNQDIPDNFTDGVFSCHCNDLTAEKEKDLTIENIEINGNYIDSDSFYSVSKNGQFLVYDRATLENNSAKIKATDQTTKEEIQFERKNFNEPLKMGLQITSINDRFLQNCSAFNQNLILHNSLQHIGRHFLHNCTALSQPIKLPNNLTEVENYFLTDCDSLVSLDIQNLDPEIFYQNPSADLTLTTGNQKAPVYNPGILIYGTNAQGFVSRFPYRGSPVYRRLRIGTS